MVPFQPQGVDFMRRIVGYLLLVVIVALLALPPIRASEDEDAKLAAFFKLYLEESFRHSPMKASNLGDHRFDHLLDDLSPKARKARLEQARKSLEALPRQVNYKKLSRSAQIDFEML